jgi:hypothetical protein
MGVDPVFGGALVFGGAKASNGVSGATYVWDGDNWSFFNNTNNAVNRFGHAMAFDRKGDKLVAFGGCVDSSNGACASDGDISNDTWFWERATPQWGDGTGNDAPFAPTTSPSARYGAAMAYDEINERIVLFGGITAVSPVTKSAQTWLWYDDDWHQACATADSCPPGPSARAWHAMAYDPNLAMVVLHGGAEGSLNTPMDDTWAWTGAGWLALGPPATDQPSARTGAGLATVRVDNTSPDADDERAVLFGGCQEMTCSTMLDDTWVFNGASWEPCAATTGAPCAGGPTERYRHAFVQGPTGKALMFGGCDVANCNTVTDETWFFDITASPRWTPCGDGSGGKCETAASKPSARGDAAVAWDTVRNEIVLFGGCIDYHASTTRECQYAGTSGYPEDTWTANPSNYPAATPWSQETVSGGSPAGRAVHAMAFDPNTGRAVLFGGCNDDDCLTLLGDTWEWNGAAHTWTELCNGGTGQQCADGSTAPPARYGHRMAYDAKRAKVVLTGGRNASGYLADTWEWDSQNQSWSQVPADPMSAGVYSARLRHAFAALPTRGQLLLFGGGNADETFADAWLWSGRVASKPAQLWRGQFAASGFDNNDTLSAVNARWDGGATAGARATPTHGASLWLWYQGDWRLVREDNSFTAATPDTISWDSAALPVPKLADALFGPNLTILLALTPKVSNGSGLYGEVRTDYVELVVDYTRVP